MAEHSQTDLYAAEAADSLTFNRLPYEIRSRLNEFSGSELKVFLCLLSHANAKRDKRTWAGIRLVMRETGLSKHGVDNAIAELKRKGWLKRYQTRNVETGQRTTATTWCKWAPPIQGSHWERVTKHRASKNDARHRVPENGVR